MIIIQLTEEQLQNSVRIAAQQAIEAALIQSQSIQDELLTKKQTAAFLGTSLPTVTSWERSGKIKAIRYGHRVYFKKSELLKPQ